MTQPESLIDLERYPIGDPTTPTAREWVGRCREQVARNGVCELDGFLRPEATTRLAVEATKCAPLAHHHEGKSTPYLELPEDHWPEGHPRKRWDDFSLGTIAFDQIPSDLRALYAWNPLMEFVRLALDLPEIHRYADPLGACSVNVFAEGDRQNLHFDHSDFVVSLALQKSDAGGEFRTTRKLRAPDEERYDRVGEILDGDTREVTTIAMRPGALVLFEGRSCLHGVSPVAGPALRLVALLSYDTQPGTCATPLLQHARYGRVERPG